MASVLSNWSFPSAEDVTSWISEYPVAVGSSLVAVFGLVAIRRWASGGRCTSKARLDGKTVIITGGNSGIGFETAKDLARRGARVILACRSKERGEKAVGDIKEATGNINVVFKKLDLASFASVRAFAADILKTEARINILINNAAWVGPYTKTEDGNEMQWQVNHLSHFLLTNLLLDKIKASAPARIINVSSLAHKWSNGIHFDDITLEKFRGKRNYEVTAYAHTKLANIIIARQLSDRLKGIDVTAYSLHPGVITTPIWKSLFICRFIYLFSWFIKSSREGAQTTIHLAVADVEEHSGKYFSDCAVKEPSGDAYNDVIGKRLWQLSEAMTGLKENEQSEEK